MFEGGVTTVFLREKSLCVETPNLSWGGIIGFGITVLEHRMKPFITLSRLRSAIKEGNVAVVERLLPDFLEKTQDILYKRIVEEKMPFCRCAVA